MKKSIGEKATNDLLSAMLPWLLIGMLVCYLMGVSVAILLKYGFWGLFSITMLGIFCGFAIFLAIIWAVALWSVLVNAAHTD